MRYEQYFVQAIEESLSEKVAEAEASPCFDCSICLEFARDPVVTLCGHLYCWPCIYQWFNTSHSHQTPNCPVCNSQISQETVVPLYGRGQSSHESQKGKEVVIPPRPSSPIKALSPTTTQHDNNNVSAEIGDGGSLNLMFGEMVYARVFGNSQSIFTYPNSYDRVVSSTPRLRRRDLQAHKSLNRVAVFLFCFALLCLLVF